MAYDLLISGGTIVDGSGAAPFRGDLAIEGGRIAAVGRADGSADRVIDAEGRAVCPGFIDVHTHYDAQVTWDPLCTPSCHHGVTTVVMGNCGYALAPVRPEDREYAMGLFSCVEQVSKQTLRSGVPWEWETQPEFLSWLRHKGLGVNVAAQVGHSALRRYVLRDQASKAEASDAQIEQMRALVRQGMEAGAIGFTTSRVAHQKGEQGEPIPSYVATEDELFRLADVLRELQRGIIGINPRTKALDFVQEDRDQLFRLAQATGRVVNWNEFNQWPDKPEQWRSLLDFMEAAQRAGAAVYAVMRCQRMDMYFNLREVGFIDVGPAWREFIGASVDDKQRRLHQIHARATLVRELEEALAKRGWEDRIGVAVGPLAGQRIGALARERGTSAAELLLEVASAESFETEFALYGVSNQDDAAVETMLKSPATLTGISDAGAHLHSFCAVDFPTHLLSYWVREKQAFSLEEAVRTLTSEPAGVIGLTDRGTLRVGAAADVCVFDPETVAPAPLEIRRDLPGGGSRHFKSARGIEQVLVNGRVLMDRGEQTEELPGDVVGLA